MRENLQTHAKDYHKYQKQKSIYPIKEEIIKGEIFKAKIDLEHS